MQGNVKLLGRSFTAAGTLAQYQPVQADGTAATAAGNAIGTADVAAVSGDRYNATVMGTALFVAGGAVAIGDPLKVGSTVTKVVAQGGTGVIIARALSAGADGDVIEALLIGN